MQSLSTDYVFMSYSRRDDAVMRRIVAFLREQGIKVWVDNEKLVPGTPVWEREIEKAVQGASAIVVVLSPDSNDSVWVRREISFADQYEKRVFPLLVRGDEKTSISIRLNDRQYVDIRSNEDAGLNLVSAALFRYLEELNEQEQSPKKEASRLAVQKADEERIALEKIVADRKAKEDADRLAVQKIEEERIALEKVVADRKTKEDAERLATQRESEQQAKIIAKPTSVVENKTVSKDNLRLFGIGGAILFLLILGGFGLNYIIKNLPVATATAPTANDTPTFELTTSTSVSFTSTPQPTETLIPTPVSFTPTSQPTNMPPADPVVGSTWTQTIDGMILLYVPAGEFLMGSTDADTSASSDEKPQHTVTLDAYWIDQTEVTNAQYAKCVADNGACKKPTNKSSYTPSSHYGNSEFDNYPVVSVDWNMANAYCSWAERELPTEAQWEKAARGIDGNIYPWGNESPNSNLLNYNQNVGDVTEVGKYPNGKSVYGAYDMAGNVWEWVSDWYRDTYYQSSPLSNPLGPYTGQYRVHRGGSWNDIEDLVTRSASRNWYTPGFTLNIIGFRCARSLP